MCVVEVNSRNSDYQTKRQMADVGAQSSGEMEVTFMLQLLRETEEVMIMSSYCQLICKDTHLTCGLHWMKSSVKFWQATIMNHHNYVPSSRSGKQPAAEVPKSVTVDMLLRLQVNKKTIEEALVHGKCLIMVSGNLLDRTPEAAEHNK